MAKMTDKFKCPQCGSGRTKPLSMAVTTGTRRRSTVGVSRRSVWGSQSTYKSDFVSSLPARPSNAGAYTLVFLGVCGLLFAWFIAVNDNSAGVFAAVIAGVGLLLLVGGWRSVKPQDQLTSAQQTWDRSWVCARCGYRWQE